MPLIEINSQSSVIDKSSPLSQGLLGAWVCNGKGLSVKDMTERYNTGELQGGIGFVSDKYGMSWDYTAAGQRVHVPYRPDLNITSPETAVVMLFKSSYTAAQQNIFTRTSGSQGWRGINIITYVDGRIDFWDGVAELASVSSVLDGKWHVVVAGRDSANRYIWIDGKLDASAAGAGDLNNTDATVRIGAENDGGRQFYGQYKLVYYYNRWLPPSEIQRITANPSCLFRIAELNLQGISFDLIPPTVSNLLVTSGTNDGELNISFDYSDVSVVNGCEIALANSSINLPSGVRTGTEYDNVQYTAFKPILKTAVSGDLPAMTGNNQGTYSCTIQMPNAGKVYVSVAAKDASNNWSNWSAASFGYVKGIGGSGGEYSHGFSG